MNHNARVIGTELFLLPVTLRAPLKFGAEVLTQVVCARARVRVCDERGMTAIGWGETPLSVQWAWPSPQPLQQRQAAMIACCRSLAQQYASLETSGHALEIGAAFLNGPLQGLVREHSIPYLAALVCASPFDIALHDAYAHLVGLPVYQTYGRPLLETDLATLFGDPEETGRFAGKYLADYLRSERSERLAAWHLVGGLDAIDPSELTGDEPDDGYPVLLTDWIQRDGLRCLKVKLRGTDPDWDYDRLTKIGRVAEPLGVRWLSADFNCLAASVEYVTDVLDRLAADAPEVFEMLMYVEQPFPYELHEKSYQVHPVAQRKPVLLDESAHDWRMVRLGKQLGWSGVALKTCKTQTGALLSLCWAKEYGMPLMVQDLTNPMLAMIPHVQLAAHVDTMMGVETNSMQFYPEASLAEQAVHPGLYVRRGGEIDLSTLQGPGFGYRLAEIQRELPAPETCCGDWSG